MKKNDEVISEVEKRILKVASKCIEVDRKGTGKLDGKVYKYALLSDIQDALKKPLKDVGLLYYFDVEADGRDGDVSLNILIATDDYTDFYESSILIKALNTQHQNLYHTIKSGITYYKRIMLSTIFNLKDMEDDDVQDVVEVKKVLVTEKNFKDVLKDIKSGLTPDQIKDKYIIPDMYKRKLNDEYKKLNG